MRHDPTIVLARIAEERPRIPGIWLLDRAHAVVLVLVPIGKDREFPHCLALARQLDSTSNVLELMWIAAFCFAVQWCIVYGTLSPRARDDEVTASIFAEKLDIVNEIVLVAKKEKGRTRSPFGLGVAIGCAPVLARRGSPPTGS